MASLLAIRRVTHQANTTGCYFKRKSGFSHSSRSTLRIQNKKKIFNLISIFLLPLFLPSKYYPLGQKKWQKMNGKYIVKLVCHFSEKARKIIKKIIKRYVYLIILIK